MNLTRLAELLEAVPQLAKPDYDSGNVTEGYNADGEPSMIVGPSKLILTGQQARHINEILKSAKPLAEQLRTLLK